MMPPGPAGGGTVAAGGGDCWLHPALSDRKRNCVVGVLSLSTRNINPGDAAAPSLPTSPLKLLPARADLILPVKTCLISL